MKISLDIISDPICPWCLIGKTRLEQAFAERPNHPFAVVWRPFQLNPEMPPGGMDRRAYLERKFGGPDGAGRVYGAIEETAKAEGLDVRFDLIARTPNTLDAHRLIRWAAPGPQQDAAVDALFDRYFFKGADIGAASVLAEIAGEIGLDAEAVAAALASDADREAVQHEDQTARRAGVGGAPTFLINGKHVVSGAQDAALWVRVIDELTQSLASQPPAATDA